MTDDNGIGFGPKRLTLKGCAKEVRDLREEHEQLKKERDGAWQIVNEKAATAFTREVELEQARELLKWWMACMLPHSLGREIFDKTRAFLDGEDK